MIWWISMFKGTTLFGQNFASDVTRDLSIRRVEYRHFYVQFLVWLNMSHPDLHTYVSFISLDFLFFIFAKDKKNQSFPVGTDWILIWLPIWKIAKPQASFKHPPIMKKYFSFCQHGQRKWLATFWVPHCIRHQKIIYSRQSWTAKCISNRNH